MWIDSHCHVTADEFAEDRAAVLDAATADGVDLMIAIGAGYGVEHNARAVALAAQDERIYAAVGVHPHDADQLDEDGERRIRQWLHEPRVVAVGECGLDYWYEHSPRRLHCYTYDEAFARRALDLGLEISFSGILTFERDRGLRAVAAALPWERLLVETDAPLLAPAGHRGQRNEPARVALVGAALAETLGRPLEEVARVTARNARALFRLPRPEGDR